MLEIEALDNLIRAVVVYQEDLQENRRLLEQAANVCDQAMGSDDIAKKYIARLYEALIELDKTWATACDVERALREDRQRAVDVLND